MSSRGSAEGESEGPRVRRILLVLWCCLIVYGSFIPFHFGMDPELVRSNLDQVQLFPFQEGRKNFSLPDVLSNILLFIPFGALISSGGSRSRGRGWRVAGSGLLALVFTTGIELGQLFTIGRRTSGIDVEAGVTGALLGAIAVCLLQRYEVWVDAGIRLVQEEPRLVPIILLVAWLCSDALYPFAVTLDVSTAWHNLKQARWVPFRGSQGFLPDRIVDGVVVFAMLSALLRSALLGRVSRGTAAMGAAVAAVALSCALQVGKLFFVGRSPNVENVLLAAIGALVGVTVVPVALAWGAIRRHSAGALAVLALALLAYSELTPFAFAFTPSALAAQFRRIEWLPLQSYSLADAQSALFDLWKKLLLSGFWGFAFARARGATTAGAAGAGLGAGTLLEAAQIFTARRIASVGDVLILGLGAWIGGIVARRHGER